VRLRYHESPVFLEIDRISIQYAWEATGEAGAGACFILPATHRDELRLLTCASADFPRASSVLFGSGYVLLAFLRGSLVHDRGWLTESQLLDAVAIGQLTPGPVFTTATFIG
jgi:hypothetical protein